MGNRMKKEAVSVLKRLEEAGYAAYFVGGYVRDTIADRPVKDIDIATSAPPQRVMEIFDRTVPTGLKHGTVTVLAGGFGFEVTTFRKESEYEAFRRPAKVEFIDDLHEDLRRRDFTMNAMAMDRKGRVVDPFGGRKDLASGVLRCVGDPDLRFREDALRMMRCIRFAAEYGLTVDPDTWSALRANVRLFRHVAMERVRAELERIVAGSHPWEGLRLLAESRLLRYAKIRPDLPLASWTAVQMPDAWKQLGTIKDPGKRWLALALTMGISAAQAESAWKAMTFPLRETKRVTELLALNGWLEAEWSRGEVPADEKAVLERTAILWKNSAVRFGPHAAEDWLDAVTFMLQSRDTGVDEERSRFPLELAARHGAMWMAEMPVLRLEDLKTNGKAVLRAVGGKPGPWLGILLNLLLVEAALGFIPNDERRLLDRAKELADESAKEEGNDERATH